MDPIQHSEISSKQPNASPFLTQSEQPSMQPPPMQPYQQHYQTQQYPPPPYQPQQQQYMQTSPPVYAPQVQYVATTPMYTHTVIVATSENSAFIGHEPAQTICPNCRATVVTSVAYEPGLVTWLTCLMIGFSGLVVCCIPFCVPQLMDAVHSCPNCRAVIKRHAPCS